MSAGNTESQLIVRKAKGLAHCTDLVEDMTAVAALRIQTELQSSLFISFSSACSLYVLLVALMSQ